jgi:hypothetical protein
VTDKNEDKVDPKQQKNERLMAEAKQLSGQGFSKEQIAQQLGAKHAMPAAEVTAVIDQDQDKDDKK